MKPLVKPRLALPVYSSQLDALTTHGDGAVRVAAAIFTGGGKIPAHATRLAEAITKALNGHRLLLAREPDATSVVEHSMRGLRRLAAALDELQVRPADAEQPIEKWQKEYPTYAALLLIGEDDEDSLVAWATAYVLTQYSGRAINTNFARKLTKESRSSALATKGGTDVDRAWTTAHRADIAALRHLCQGTSGASEDFQRDACSSFIWRSKLPGRNDRHALVHDRCLTLKAFEEAAAYLHLGLMDGDGVATAICTGFLSGLSWPLFKCMPLVRPSGDDWVIWLDVDEGCLWVNLNPIARNAAVAKGDVNYVPATRTFRRYLPAEVVRGLRRLRILRPEASNVGVLTGTVDVAEEYEIGPDTRHVLKSSIARFFNTRASLAKHLELSGPMTALVLGDFGRVPHSRLYYHAATPHRLDEAVEKLSRILGWGRIESAKLQALAIGAAVVPSSEAVAQTARTLASRVLAARPPKRYGWDHVRRFHNALADYTSFLLSLGMMGRARASVVIVGARWIAETGLAGLHDKKTVTSEGATAVAACRQMREQLSNWFKHLESLLVRLDKLGLDQRALRNRVQSILDAESSSIVFKIDERGRPVDTGSTAAYAALDEADRVKADSARHFWESYFDEHGIDDVLVDAQARRNVRWSQYWHTTSTLSGARLRRVLGTMQERVLDDLGIRAIKGFVK